MVDGEHCEGALHGDEAADAGVDGFEFEAGQSVCGRTHSRAPVAVEVHAEDAEFAQFLREVAGREFRLFEPLGDVRADAVGRELAHGVADCDLFRFQQRVEGEELGEGLSVRHVVLQGPG